MKIIKNAKSARKFISSLVCQRKSVGFVPTMGALHDGHISLIKRARKENNIVIVSIFVNPKQFGKNEDFEKYPRMPAKDRRICAQNGVDILFCPSSRDMYGENHLSFVEVKNLSEILCGKYRPGHFRGVATVVLKLFNIIQPSRAYFGQKDYQQLKIIEKMVDDLDISVKAIGCPTIREKSGLALSSRNKYLSAEQKKLASGIYAVLKKAKNDATSRKINSATELKNIIVESLRKISGLKIEYVAVVDPKTLLSADDLKGEFRILVAAWLGKTRLIDNV